MPKTTVAEVSTPYATFWSGGQKIASNAKGTMVGMIVSQNSEYMSQTIQIMFYPVGDGPPATVYTLANVPTHAPIIEAAESGEFYAFFINWSTGEHYTLFWEDVAANRTPVVNKSVKRSFTSVKSCAVWDEARRSLWSINNGTGVLMRWSERGEWISERNLLANTKTGELQYPLLTMTPQGWLAMAVSSHEKGSPTPHYRALVTGWSPYPESEAWATLRTSMDDWGTAFPSVSTKPIPVDDGPLLLSRGEEMNWSHLISAFFVEVGAAHIVYSVVPKRAGKFVAEGGRQSYMVYQKFDTRVGKRTILTTPLRIGALKPSFPGSFLTRRLGVLYQVIVTGLDLVLASSDDDGMSWREAQRMQAADSGMIHYLSCWRGFDSDDTIEGVFTNIDCTLQQWADGTGYPQPGRVIRFEFSL